MNVLTRLQRAFLSRFFSRPSGQQFYLTGGVALSEFYLQHRLSQDLDLFTESQSAFEMSEGDLVAAASEVGAQLIRFHPPRPGDTLSRCFITLAGEPEIKIDVVQDAPPHFGQVILQRDGVRVDSLENLAVGKLLAVFGRAYPRDFVDLYFLMKNNVSVSQLIIWAKQKDLGFSEYFLGGMLEQVTYVDSRDLPRMLKPINVEDMKLTLLDLAARLKGVKPS